MVLKETLPIDVVDSGNFAELSVTIAAGQTTSNKFQMWGATMMGVKMPGAWTAGTIGFLESRDNGTYRTLADNNGNPVLITVPTANYTHKLDTNMFYGVEWVQLVSSVPQAADRVLEIMMARV